MSYLVLARKYRPQIFAEVVGQAPVVKTLQNSLLHQRIAHAILFSGVRGVGKTTLARIMAKAINCEADTDSKPCNECSSCSQITKGQSLDLHEIDGASNRGIQEIRELKEKIRFLPTSSKYKIIIIDEVHMLTTEAFNALLKTLEEPPAHVYFMFATTELHKIPITILSRCQRYELKRVPAVELTTHFEKIAQAENITIEPAALSLIVREAGGSVRDGISLLDQMFAYGDTTISHKDVIEVLGLTDRDIILTITKALLEGDRATALKTLEGAFEYGIDLKRFTSDLLECMRNLLLIKMPDCGELIDLPAEEITQLQEIGGAFNFETLHLKLSLMMKATEELRYTSQPRIALETAFLKIIEAGSVVPVSELLGQVTSLLQGDTSSAAVTAETAETAEKKPTSTPAEMGSGQPSATVAKKKPEAELYEEPQIPKANDQVEELPPPEDADEPPLASTEPFAETAGADDLAPPDAEKEDKMESPPVIAPHPHTHDVRRDWDDFIEYVKDRKVWMAKDLQLAETAREKDGELHLHYNDPVTCTLLRNKENRKLLTTFVLDFFQKDLSVRFILPDMTSNGDDNGDEENPHLQRQQLVQNPLVQMTVEIFNGQVGDIRIGPRSR
ncbi:MAG: DNA polymerase III subunit gamma/tau [Desulfocapsaceae bacterium]|nr:DNA polymerase III subunit gamma/tau [Desulfocapsaceae bacterium]